MGAKGKLAVLIFLAAAAYVVYTRGFMATFGLGPGDPTQVRADVEYLKTDGTIVEAVVDLIGVGRVDRLVEVECTLRRPDGTAFKSKKGRRLGSLDHGELDRLTLVYNTGHAVTPVSGDSRRVKVDGWGGDAYVDCEVLAAH